VNLSCSESFKKFISIFIIIAITYSFCISFIINLPFLNLIGKSDKEKLLELNPEYFGLLIFASEIMEPESNALFFDSLFYQYAQPYYYPEYNCEYYAYNSYTTNEQILGFLKNNSIDYILIISTNFPLSTNTTYFHKYNYDSQYLLEINKTALQ